jgi:membrane-bound inhibitor of C-type lysozyme
MPDQMLRIDEASSHGNWMKFALCLIWFMVGCHFVEPTPSSRSGAQIKGSAESKLRASFLLAYTFNCASGPTIVTRIVDRDAIDLVLSDEVRRLRREQTASGVKYSDPDVSLWSKGREVTLQIRGRGYLCVEERAGSIREDALVRGVQFRAAGEKAEWILEVLKDQISFTDSV